MNPEEYNRRLGARIALVRKRRGLSAAKLGEQIGRHVTSVSRYENGRNAVSVKDLEMISWVLDVDASIWFMSEVFWEMELQDIHQFPKQ